MQQFIREQNIRLLLKALDGESDPQRRRTLERLLAQWRGEGDLPEQKDVSIGQAYSPGKPPPSVDADQVRRRAGCYP